MFICGSCRRPYVSTYLHQCAGRRMYRRIFTSVQAAVCIDVSSPACRRLHVSTYLHQCAGGRMYRRIFTSLQEAVCIDVSSPVCRRPYVSTYLHQCAGRARRTFALLYTASSLQPRRGSHGGPAAAPMEILKNHRFIFIRPYGVSQKSQTHARRLAYGDRKKSPIYKKTA